jgi:hypothetical protein
VNGQQDLLREATALLDKAGIPHMISGSIASTYYGRARATQDIDIVIDTDEQRLLSFVSACERRAYYVDRQAAREALAGRSMFNVIDPSSGYKIDLIVRRERPFSSAEFARRSRVQLPAGTVCLVSAEDALLSTREGASERQYRDALGIALSQRGRLDLAYLRWWAHELGIHAALERVLAEAERDA